MATHPTDESAIREQAYFLWEQDGRPEGREMEYWQRATVVAAEKGQMDTIAKAPPKLVEDSRQQLAAIEAELAKLG